MQTTGDILQKGVEHQLKGDFATASELYDLVLEHDPLNADAWHLSGLVAFQIGQHDAAEQLIERAIKLRPQNNDYPGNLAAVYLAQERYREAEGLCRRLINGRRDHLEAWKHLCTALRKQNRREEALEAGRKAIELAPEDPACLGNLGAVLLDVGRIDDAHRTLLKARSRNNRLPHVHINLGVAQRELGQGQAACDSFDTAIQLNGQSAEPFVNRGNLFLAKGDISAARADYQAALQCESENGAAWNGLGRAFQAEGRWQEAVEAASNAVAAAGDGRYQSEFLYCLTLCPLMSREDKFLQHRRWGEQIEAETPVYSHAERSADPDRPLTIGYVSGDFYHHAAMKFFQPAAEHHDRSNYRIILYSETRRRDFLNAELRESADIFRDTFLMSDTRLGEVVLQDEVDILIDLSGHTANNRLRVFAAKPAPVQMSFLGYPATTGLSTVDYFLTDAVRESGSSQAWFTEQLIALPHGACTFTPPSPLPDVGPLPASANSYVTFGSTHRPEKISDECLVLWAEILRKRPTARLRLVRDAFAAESLRDTMTARLTKQGVAADRIEYCWEIPKSFCEIYQEIDVLLDVFPWPGGTTSYEAMWMGVPVPSFHQEERRNGSGASLLHFSGHDDLIAESPQAWTDLVATLAADVGRLSVLRSELRQRMEQSFGDHARFTQSLEQVYRDAWKKWCEQASVQRA